MKPIYPNKTFIMLAFILLLGVVISPAQNTAPAISEEQAMIVDSLVAENAGLDPVEFHKSHTFITVTGTEYDIYLAVASSSEEASGGQFSAYSWQHKLTAVEETVLTDSLPNSCISIVDLDDYNITEAYQTFAENHWIDCDYVNTDIKHVERNRLKVYPNPAQNGFYIETDKQVRAIRIVDLTGRAVYQQNRVVHSGKPHYISAELSRGVYLVKAYDRKGLSGSERLIVK